MKIIVFKVTGNQENPEGNPLGYYRTTQGSFWNKGSKRYSAWKNYVVGRFLKQYNQIGNGEKPIDLGDKKAEVHISIKWANKLHSDCDNVFKGILDSLFVNDKNVYKGSFESEYSDDKVGSVDITIKII